MPDVTPDRILQLLSGHMTAKYLFIATRLRLFELLLPAPLPLDALAAQSALPPRRLRIVLDALVATGWLTCHERRYANSAVTAAFLSGEPGPDLRPILQLWDQIVYPQWATLETALRTGQATYGFADFTPAEQHTFAVGVEALTAPSAQALAATYAFQHHQRLLDIGGGTGSFAVAALRAAPTLQATLFELPATTALVRQRLAAGPDLPKLAVLDGNMLEDPIPSGYDVLLLANVLHLFSVAVNRQLLQRVRAAVRPGTRLLLVDFWTDPTHTQPPFAALMAGEFLVVTGDGDVYSSAEATVWLGETGWQLVEHRPLAGAASLMVAEAVAP